MKNEWGLYIHVPFCKKRCSYCGFFTGSAALKERKSYVWALTGELVERSSEVNGDIHTLYIGGGTPSLLNDEEMRVLMGSVREVFGERFAPVESTIEVNPEDVSDEKIHLWRSLGFNRVSIGVQTFDDRLLGEIGRIHDAGCARRALKKLKEGFENVSLDLMFGLPGQTAASFAESLDEALGFAPQHISVYSLMFEERSALNALLQRGEVEETGEVDYQEMFCDMSAKLALYGYEHYEISNFALPGFRSLHNSSYWKGKPYLGLGAGAHSYDGAALRRSNINDLKAYVRRYTGMTAEQVAETENLSQFDLVVEKLITSLRRKEGIDLKDYRKRFGEEEYERLMEAVRTIEPHLIECDEARIGLTLSGMMVSDDVTLRLIPD